METRKRLIADTNDDAAHHPKKRLAVEHNGSPVAPTSTTDDEPKDENLEVRELCLLPCDSAHT